MNVFSTKPKVDEVVSLMNESQTIIKSFLKTATDLSAVNIRIEDVKLKKQEEIHRLMDEKDELERTQEANSKLVNKINAFLD